MADLNDLKAQLRSSPGVQRLLHSNRKDRAMRWCEQCGRRIAWWTVELRYGFAGVDGVFRGWKWQGKRPVLRFAEDGFIDVDWQGERPVLWFERDIARFECQLCGAPAAARQPYPFWWKAAPEIL